MNREYIKQDLAHLLETISEQVENVYGYENRIPQIEIDLLLKNVQRFYEQLTALNKLNSRDDRQITSESGTPGKQFADSNTSISPASLPTPKGAIEKETFVDAQNEPVASQKDISPSELIEIAASSITTDVNETPEQQTGKNVDIETEPIINIQETITIKATAAESKPAPRKNVKTTASLFDSAPSLAEQFDDATTLKEKLSADKKGKSVAEKLHQQKIEDIKKAIGINEKFLFINELFEGSLTTYNEHIDKINQAADINHARSIIDSLIAKYNWEGESQQVKNFIELVERRFI